MIRRCAAQEHTRSRGKNEIKALAFLAVKLSRIIPYKGLLISHLTGSVMAFRVLHELVDYVRPFRGDEWSILNFLTTRKILPLLDFLAKFKRVLTKFLQLLACSPSCQYCSKFCKSLFGLR